MARLGPVDFEDRLTLVEHLDELRKRIVISIVAFSVAVVGVTSTIAPVVTAAAGIVVNVASSLETVCPVALIVSTTRKW